MKSSLSTTEITALYAKMTTLIKAKSKFVNDNTKYFTNDMIATALDESLLYICDYINRPDRYMLDNPTLIYIWADMCIDILKGRYNEDNPDSATGDSDVGSVISSIKMANATISYGGSDNSSESTDTPEDAANLMKKYTSRLKKYRRIY